MAGQYPSLPPGEGAAQFAEQPRRIATFDGEWSVGRFRLAGDAVVYECDCGAAQVTHVKPRGAVGDRPGHAG